MRQQKNKGQTKISRIPVEGSEHHKKRREESLQALEIHKMWRALGDERPWDVAETVGPGEKNR